LLRLYPIRNELKTKKRDKKLYYSLWHSLLYCLSLATLIIILSHSIPTPTQFTSLEPSSLLSTLQRIQCPLLLKIPKPPLLMDRGSRRSHPTSFPAPPNDSAAPPLTPSAASSGSSLAPPNQGLYTKPKNDASLFIGLFFVIVIVTCLCYCVTQAIGSGERGGESWGRTGGYNAEGVWSSDFGSGIWRWRFPCFW